MVPWSFPVQIIFNGLILGLGYSVIAAGIVLIFRSSGVINFAQAAMGAFGVGTFVVLTQNLHVPYAPAMVLGVAGGVLLGVATDRLVIRRLFDASRVVVLIATVGVAQLITLLIIEVLPDTEGGVVPTAFTASWAQIHVTDDLFIGPRQTSLILLVTPAIVALGLLLNRTRMGLHIRAVADSPENARLIGVSPRTISTLVWGLGAGFAAYTQIVMAPIVSPTSADLATVGTIGLLLRALVIAMCARMRSIPVVVLAGLGLGVTEAVVSLNLNRDVGAFDALLFVGVLVMVLLLSRTSSRERVSFSMGAHQRPVPEALRGVWWVRCLPASGVAVLVVAGLVVPFVQDKPSQMLVWTELLIVAMLAISLSLLIGWAGQLSLGQAAFAGVGGLSMLAFTRGQPLGIGLPLVGNLATVSIDVPWAVALVMATGVGVLFAVLVGLPALRVRGLFLAVTTLAFGNLCSSWMFSREFWSGGEFSVPSARNERPSFAGIDLGSPRAYYYLCLGLLCVTAVVVAHLRRTGSGRLMIAVRDNEEMTSVATVSPMRAKLSAFAVSGAIAAMAGGLYVFLLPGFPVSGEASPFSPEASLQLVAIAIIGGVGTVVGGVLGALWVVGLPAALGASDAVKLMTANVGLLLLLLYLPGGLVQVLYSGRDRLLRRVAARSELPEPAAAATSHLTTRERQIETPEAGAAWLRTSSVSVHFGGVTAVDAVDLAVFEGEVVGLVGTNGAGKSTLMNAISGFVPHTGSVEVLGRDVSDLAAHQRHAVGLGRGFQDARLFGSLTVRESVLVALEARQRSLLLPSLLALPPSPSMERVRHAEASEILDFFGLGPSADDEVADQSTGTRRVVELACLVATDAKVLLLDEPTAGISQQETEQFAPLIREVQRDLGAAVVLIEHDMPLVMSLSDRVYCLEAGAVIASGSPAEVTSHPAVIASYLGTDPRAIERSNQSSGVSS